MSEARVSPLGDSAITIELATERSPGVLQEVRAAAQQIRSAGIESIQDIVPAYLAVTVFYDPLRQSFAEISERVRRVLAEPRQSYGVEDSTQHVIPVRYEGLDLDSVAAATSLSTDEVIELHGERTYTVDLLGFVPGFAYLSELDSRLQIPRRAQPRPRVTAGSVAIAATQTAVYPLDTPGGWHIIGSTRTVIFDATRNPPALFKAGDTVRFERVR